MATPPPSQFAALLRRSKFASFDPSIGQVYTTFDGNAARGNFGLKRPLALRRRNAHITVQAIDSREQQTVWKSAEPQNRWIRMFDETGATPTTVKNSGPWMTRLGPLAEISFEVDSDLVPQREEVAARKGGEPEPEVDSDAVEEPPKSQAVRNLDAMSDSEFDWYLRRLRDLRPAFREYLKKYAKKTGEPSEAGDSLLSWSIHATGDSFKEFLAHKAYVDYRAPRPRHIEQQPHRYAGLNYTRSTPLQTQLMAKPHLGRVIGQLPEKESKHGTVVATVGMTSILRRGGQGGEAPPPVTTFRFNTIELEAAPATVGVVPEGLEGVKIKSTVRVDSEVTRMRQENPHPPGSKAYVAHVGAVSLDLGMVQAPSPAAFTPPLGTNERRLARTLLGSLEVISGTRAPQ